MGAWGKADQAGLYVWVRGGPWDAISMSLGWGWGEMGVSPGSNLPTGLRPSTRPAKQCC